MGVDRRGTERFESDWVRRYEGYFQREDKYVEFWPLEADGKYGYDMLSNDATVRITRVKLGAVKPRAVLERGAFRLEVSGKVAMETPLNVLDGDGFMLSEPVYVAARQNFRPVVALRNLPVGGVIELYLYGVIAQDVL